LTQVKSEGRCTGEAAMRCERCASPRAGRAVGTASVKFGSGSRYGPIGADGRLSQDIH
jgi:hypothetical protein